MPGKSTKEGSKNGGILGSDRYEERLKEMRMTTLKQKRHQPDMQQTNKILHRLDEYSKKCGSAWQVKGKEQHSRLQIHGA
jgi:hypothetical protein